MSRVVSHWCQISDENFKAFVSLCDAHPYGDIAIIKHECVGNVQKRVGKFFSDSNMEKSLKMEQ